MLPPIEIEGAARFIEKFADRVGFAGGNNKIARLGVLQHHPHGFDVVAGETPVAFGVEISEKEFVLQAQLDAGERAGDLASDEGFAAARRFVVEQNAVGDVQVVGFAIVDGLPVGRHFGDGIGAAGIEGSASLWGGLAAPNISDDPA